MNNMKMLVSNWITFLSHFCPGNSHGITYPTTCIRITYSRNWKEGMPHGNGSRYIVSSELHTDTIGKRKINSFFLSLEHTSEWEHVCKCAMTGIKNVTHSPNAKDTLGSWSKLVSFSQIVEGWIWHVWCVSSLFIMYHCYPHPHWMCPIQCFVNAVPEMTIISHFIPLVFYFSISPCINNEVLVPILRYHYLEMCTVPYFLPSNSSSRCDAVPL